MTFPDTKQQEFVLFVKFMFFLCEVSFSLMESGLLTPIQNSI